MPLDATHRAPLTREDAAGWAALGTAAGTAAAGLLGVLLDAAGPRGAGTGVPVHDALCVAALADPAVLTTAERVVTVETADPDRWGATTVRPPVPAEDARPVRVAVDADPAAFRAALRAALSRGPSTP